MNYQIIRLTDRPEMKEQAARWFHEKWKIPLEAYMESMEECLAQKNAVPQWYMALEGDRIIGGLGVIENDFHDRKDLTPNVCAVYTEKEKRCNGVAGALLNYVCSDMKEKGITTLYLITDHTSFYERYGWEFLCMVQGDGEADKTRMYTYFTKERSEKMKKFISGILLFLVVFGLSGCVRDEQVKIKNTFEETPSDLIAEYMEDSKEVIFSTYYEMSDGTWKIDDDVYRYRLEVTGRLHNAVKDTTYIILSNIEDISFEQAWKASGLSSNTDDYFEPEEAVFVGYIAGKKE